MEKKTVNKNSIKLLSFRDTNGNMPMAEPNAGWVEADDVEQDAAVEEGETEHCHAPGGQEADRAAEGGPGPLLCCRQLAANWPIDEKGSPLSLSVQL